MLGLGLVIWIVFTPCAWHSPPLYLPPVLTGLVVGLRQPGVSWRMRLTTAWSYALALLVSIAVVMVFTADPLPLGSLWAVTLATLLGVGPLALLAFTLGEYLGSRWRGG